MTWENATETYAAITWSESTKGFGLAKRGFFSNETSKSR